MEQRLEDALFHLLLENGGGVVFRLAAVNDERQTGFARRLDMDAETPRLDVARAVVIVIIEPRFADADHLGMAVPA